MFYWTIKFPENFFAVQSYGAVVHLTESNFASVIDGSKNALVEFYAPW